MSKIDETELTPAAAAEAHLAVSPEIMATNFNDYIRASFARVKAGESGVLPVLGGLLLISILFQSLNSNFLSSGNLVNLLIQGAVFMLLAMGEVYVLLLGEIDLSFGFVAGIGGVVTAELVRESTGWPWWAAILVALLVCALIGYVQGTIITRLGQPSFVVTLAGFLGLQGVMLLILGPGGSVPINDKVINDLASANLTPAVSWAVMLAAAGVFAFRTWRREEGRRASGLVAPPRSLTLVKVAAAFASAAVAWVSVSLLRLSKMKASAAAPPPSATNGIIGMPGRSDITSMTPPAMPSAFG
jgi:D-xylose transport system permease protein